MKHFLLATAIVPLLIACDAIVPSAPAAHDVLDGPVDGLTHEEQIRHLAGDVAFNDDVFTASTGLGPIFVATSCGTCHASDGKGHPFTTLIRFGQSDASGNRYLDAGGPQLQNRALPGYKPEQLPAGAPFSRFMPPLNVGLGYLDALTDAQLLANADPEDRDGDGISGVPNYVHPPSYYRPRSGSMPVDGRYIGRYGKKAAAIDLLQQTVTAYNQDIGIASTYNPLDVYSGHDVDPEVSNQTIHDVVFYLQTLKAPTQRNADDARVQAGKRTFSDIGCASCHVPTFTTPSTSIAALSDKTIHPYTDLLLHDMGAELDDGYTEGTALTSEWKTPPLWGLGLAPTSQGGQYFLLHDGRAHSIEEAILYHGGEGAKSRERYRQLPAHDKEALIKFLESL